jgi:hypothetical protein
MCAIEPNPEGEVLGGAFPFGHQCPLCASQSVLGHMKFRDPHGMDRTDPDLFECSSRRHSFAVEGDRCVRLLASEGRLQRQKRLFSAHHGRLREV